MSHYGRGLELRRAGATAADQFVAVVGTEHQLVSAAVTDYAMVEAFPNTFMGVLLPEVLLDRLPSGRSKSDRLYDACLAEGVFDRLVAELGWPVADTVAQLAAERDHDLRAAYICLLTAGVAHAGTAVVVGDAVGGVLAAADRVMGELGAGGARSDLGRSQQAASLPVAAARVPVFVAFYPTDNCSRQEHSDPAPVHDGLQGARLPGGSVLLRRCVKSLVPPAGLVGLFLASSSKRIDAVSLMTGSAPHFRCFSRYR